MIMFLEQYLGNQLVLLVPAYTPVTPTCCPSILHCRVEHHKRHHRLTACPSPSLSHNPMSLIKKYETVASGQHVSVSQHSPYIKQKTELPQSQNLLLTLKKLWLHQPCCFSKTVSHTCNRRPKQGTGSTEYKN